MFKGDWTTCSKYDNHSKLKVSIIGGHLYDHLMRKRNIILIINIRYSYEA